MDRCAALDGSVAASLAAQRVSRAKDGAGAATVAPWRKL